MALSAYDEDGRQKKHALQGTGLGAATDKPGTAQREQFRELHQEALSENLTEAQMKTRLQGRFDQWGGHQQSRLAEIAKQRGEMDERYASTGDPEAERRFDIYEQQGLGGWKFDKGFKQEGKAAWEEKGGAAGSRYKDAIEFRGKDTWEAAFGGKKEQKALSAARRDLSDPDSPLRSMTSKKELKKFRTEEGYRLSKDARRTIAKKNRRALKNYRADRWKSMYDWKAAKAYEDRRAAVAEEIDETYIPLGVEAGERQGMIQDRLELYNLFLGE